ncbi:efflux RND transporter periplasmic adaptor subunit [Lederbergia wuyishanensis]|uniref:Multidrug resistance efflux pump n=1 Tax=Lederbergia wuyishanensis TaxID=1347903 RepID=A0ABU0DAD2_9BACI|nr:efflux RND transporter periplasmic adaptor subunit [Lederbergia wuyishanensis]MCJ8010088.1 efflux RND transporter periplasmic adaptor subunit [Lederbergia wuyishanensis]MDQ0345327.1 multidrug resistance efflux pump [Lederbergia wuyishanensis]
MNAKRMILLNVFLLVILVGGGFAGYYYYNQKAIYLKTNNAQIAGQQVNIASPVNGQLIDWKVKTGDSFNKGDTLGKVEMNSDQGRIEMDIKAPTDGTIVRNNAVKNTIVGAGIPLAISYDFNNLWVTANVEETDLKDIKIGQDVDIYVDAYPNTTLYGTVDEIGLATAGTFSLLPSSNATGNYTKETQVIPIKINIEAYAEKLIPGMNVTVRIHK